MTGGGKGIVEGGGTILELDNDNILVCLSFFTSRGKMPRGGD
jgi:hypothetical protein